MNNQLVLGAFGSEQHCTWCNNKRWQSDFASRFFAPWDETIPLSALTTDITDTLINPRICCTNSTAKLLHTDIAQADGTRHDQRRVHTAGFRGSSANVTSATVLKKNTYVRMCIAHILSLARALSLIGCQLVRKSVQNTASLSSLFFPPSLPPSFPFRAPSLSTFSSTKRSPMLVYPWQFLSRRAVSTQLVGAEKRACLCGCCVSKLWRYVRVCACVFVSVCLRVSVCVSVCVSVSVSVCQRKAAICSIRCPRET
jgi:hypothetical protein